MNEPILSKLRDILSEHFGIRQEEVTPESRIVEDLGADSLDVVELVMSVEEEFGIDIPDDDAEGIYRPNSTVRHWVEYLEANAE